MNYLLTQEQKEYQKMVRDFVQKELLPVTAEYDRKGEFPLEVYKKAAEMGIHCVEIPESYGGPGLDDVTAAIITEELGKGDAGFAASLGANGLGIKPIFMAGTEDQKKYVADLVLGGGMCAFALTEPEAGSDAGSCKTTAVKDGDDYIINGRKCFITNAAYADVFTVIASVDRSLGVKGLTMFLVDKNTPGLSVGKEEDKMGIRLSNTCDVLFENVRIPAKNIVGKEGQGFKLAMATLDLGRTAAAVTAVGVAQAAFEYAVKYAQERKTFGKPIIANQSIQFMLADMETEIEVARQMALYAVHLSQAKSPMLTKVGAQAKCFASEMVVKVTSDAIQILGGYGYMRDYPVEKLMRDAKIFPIFEGTNQIQKMVISGNIIQEYKI